MPHRRAALRCAKRGRHLRRRELVAGERQVAAGKRGGGAEHGRRGGAQVARRDKLQRAVGCVLCVFCVLCAVVRSCKPGVSAVCRGEAAGKGSGGGSSCTERAPGSEKGKTPLLTIWGRVYLGGTQVERKKGRR